MPDFIGLIERLSTSVDRALWMHHPAAAHVAPMMPERQAARDHAADHQRGAERIDVNSPARARDWRRLASNDYRRGLPRNRRRIVLDDHR
jgi:hypothetical protein